MRAIDADRLLDRCKFYHLPNGDIAVPIIDVQHAPTIEIEPNWIPVTEGLPKESGSYQVTTKRGKVAIYVFGADSISSHECWKRSVIAWMPLPEPYKGVTE